ncbi:MAG: hypothetical protein ACOX52_00245 [Verrucomicrobiota bacterium]|nr:hypothetical protein [Verrucomicrobiota bacterium]
MPYSAGIDPDPVFDFDFDFDRTDRTDRELLPGGLGQRDCAFREDF